MGKLSDIATGLVAEGKGILAADESTGTMEKRLSAIGVESTEKIRREYRELLFTTEGIEEYISGVIMFDETIRQRTGDGVEFPRLLAERGIIPGIKVDTGKVDMPGHSGEQITEGLDGLGGRLMEYGKLGAKFAKWRAVIGIGDGIPTQACIEVNAQKLALYSAFAQEAGMVPVVEPEVLMDGRHDMEKCGDVTTAVLKNVFFKLEELGVELGGILLKPNMVLSGKDSGRKVSDNEIGEMTLETMKRSVPEAVPGIVFLSGGQSPEEASRRLNAMNKIDNVSWELSFSYGRALQRPVLEAWGGEAENREKAQKVFLERARLNGLARRGEYSAAMEGK